MSENESKSLKEIHALSLRARDLFDRGKIDESEECYHEICAKYKLLTHEGKEMVFKFCKELHDLIFSGKIEEMTEMLDQIEEKLDEPLLQRFEELYWTLPKMELGSERLSTLTSRYEKVLERMITL